jgi:hypothetical protein
LEISETTDSALCFARLELDALRDFGLKMGESRLGLLAIDGGLGNEKLSCGENGLTCMGSPMDI